MRWSLLGAVALLIVGATSVAQASGERLVFATGPFVLSDPSGREADAPSFGAGLGLSLLEHRDEAWQIRSGFDLQGGAAATPAGSTVIHVSVAFVATLGLGEEAASPFVAFGPALVLVNDPAEGRSTTSLGVRADLGLHGILFDRLYWRVSLGVVGPLAAGLRGMVAVGYVL